MKIAKISAAISAAVLAGALALMASADLTPIAQITSTWDEVNGTINGHWAVGSAGMVGQNLTDTLKVESEFAIPEEIDPASIESVTIEYKATNANGEWGNGAWMANSAGAGWQQTGIIAADVTEVSEITLPLSLVDENGELTDWYSFGFVEYGGASYDIYSVVFNVSENTSSEESSEADASSEEQTSSSQDASSEEQTSSSEDASSEEQTSSVQDASSEAQTDSSDPAADSSKASVSSAADKGKDKNPNTGAAALGGLGVLLAGAAVATVKRK